MGNTPRLASVIGSPISHSLSPTIHQFWADKAHVHGYYFPVEPGLHENGFEEAVAGLKAIGVKGCNVTLPFKERALALADKASSDAKEIGAANMLTFTGDEIIADNSDLRGFVDAIMAAGFQQADNTVVLGAGGVSRALIVGIKRAAPKTKITVVNRTYERAKSLAKAFQVDAAAWNDMPDVMNGADFIVNATSLGMSGQEPLDADLSNAAPDAFVFDSVYTPMKTELIIEAEHRKFRVANGLDMLIAQAKPGFRAWFGAEPCEIDELRLRLIEKLRDTEK